MATLIIRPNSTGNSTTHSPIGAANNWDCVDESIADEGATYVFNSNVSFTLLVDRYGLTNSTGQTGPINSVTVTIRVWCASIGVTQSAATQLRTNGANFGGSSNDLSAVVAPANFSKVYTTNPATSASWTWAQIDALQAGVQSISDNSEVRCTQVFVTVDYTDEVLPSINLLTISALQPTIITHNTVLPDIATLDILPLQPTVTLGEFNDFETLVFDPRARIPARRGVRR